MRAMRGQCSENKPSWNIHKEKKSTRDMLGDWHDNGGQLVWREKAKDNLSGSPPKQKSAGAG